MDASRLHEFQQRLREMTDSKPAAINSDDSDEDASPLAEGVQELAEEIVCPISHALPVDPVLAADGFTYDRAQIEAWLRKHNTSPVTGAEMRTKRLVPNYPMRIQIQQYHAGAR